MAAMASEKHVSEASSKRRKNDGWIIWVRPSVIERAEINGPQAGPFRTNKTKLRSLKMNGSLIAAA